MKLGDKIIMMLANSYCGLWHKLRCRTFRRIDDFNYHVFALDNNTQIPVIDKVVEINNLYEKTVSVKIGNVCIRYSFDKTLRNCDIPTNTNPEWLVQRALIKETIKSHHKAKVFKFKDRRVSDVERRSSHQ